MNAKVVGKEKVDYFSKKTNKQVTGIRLHVTKADRRVEGLAVEPIFVSSASDAFDEVQKLPLNSEVDIYYNQWGYIDSVQACK